MQEHELARRLINVEDFEAVRDSLDRMAIPYYIPNNVFQWQERRYKSLTFLDGDKNSVFKELSLLSVRKYTHPTGEAFRYPYDGIYRLMFREDAKDILIGIEDPESKFFDAKNEMDIKIRDFISKIEHATRILGEDFLTVKHYEIRLKEVVDEMKKFLKKVGLK